MQDTTINPPYARLADLMPLAEKLKAIGDPARAVTLALARGIDKCPVDKGYLDRPLTVDQVKEWDEQMASDPKKHFFLLLRQCDPQLSVLDIDDLGNAFSKELMKVLDDASCYCAPSRKGKHYLVLNDSGADDFAPRGSHRVDIANPKRKGSARVGDFLTYGSVAYRGTGDLVEFSQVPGLYTTLTGKEHAPEERYEMMKGSLIAEIGEMGQLQGSRHVLMYRLCAGLSKRLAAVGMLDRIEDLAGVLGKHYAAINPDDETFTRAEIARIVDKHNDHLGDSNFHDKNPEARCMQASFEMVSNLHLGHLFIDGADGTDRKRKVHAWDPSLNDWVVRRFEARVEGGDGISFATIIGDAFDKVHRDLFGGPPALTVKDKAIEHIWKECRRCYTVENISMVFDYPERGSTVRHLNIGDGKVIKVDASPDALKDGRKGWSIIPNQPEFRAAKKMVGPGKKENELFIEKVNEILPEEGVAEYLWMRMAECLLPDCMRQPDFLSAVGGGGNGKSLLLSSFTRAFDELAVTVDISAIQQPRGGGEMSPRQLKARMRMMGALLIAIHEGDNKHPLDEAAIKTFTAGEETNTGGMYQDDVRARITGKIMVLSNKRLRLDTPGKSIRRRARQFIFSQTFDDGTSKRVDHDLGTKIARDLPGVVATLLRYVTKALEFRRDNPGASTPMPDIIEKQTDEWMDEQDIVQARLRAFLVPAEAKVPAMIKGRNYGGKATGISALADLIAESEASQRKGLFEAKRFLLNLYGQEIKKYPLMPTAACMDFIANLNDELRETALDDLFYGLFSHKDRARAEYGKMWLDAKTRALGDEEDEPVSKELL